jgi:hypothetical protein
MSELTKIKLRIKERTIKLEGTKDKIKLSSLKNIIYGTNSKTKKK